MAIKASAAITLSSVVDVFSTTRYYLLQSSTQAAPAKPTTNPPTGGWDDTEPSYTSGSTNTLYFTDLTVFSDGSWAYSMVSVSSAYEAAKAAWNKAAAAQSAVTNLNNALTQREIFNRLTDNGAAQGLVLYDGQLYINASYINAGELSVRLVNFSDYTPPYNVPNEFDPDSLLSGQTVQDGWIVNTSGGYVTVLECDNAVPLRGQTLEITVVTPQIVDGMNYWMRYIDEDEGDEREAIGATEFPAYGTEDAEGNLRGATMDGDDYRCSFSYIVGSTETAFSIAVTSRKARSIVVTDAFSKNFGLRYGNNIGLNYKGLQVGKFVVDRSGNATFNGVARFNGGVSDDRILTTSQAISIPAAGGSVSKNMAGLTSEHELVRWNFSSSAENNPPADLTWTTYNGYFTISNTSGTTSESICPVFALPKAVAITTR